MSAPRTPRAAYARHLALAACTCRRPEAGTCQWCVKAADGEEDLGDE